MRKAAPAAMAILLAICSSTAALLLDRRAPGTSSPWPVVQAPYSGTRYSVVDLPASYGDP